MFSLFMGNSMWQLVAQSDTVSKLVLLFLLGMSIICWTIFLYKVILLRLKKRHMFQAMERIRSLKNIEEMLSVASDMAQTVPGFFLSKNLTFLKSMLERHKERGKTELQPQDWEEIQQHLYQTVDAMVYNDESYLSFLSTSAAVAPLLGLFGTVWGLVHAFIRISERQSADITTVAPGLAEALITTLAGLIVAIPALIMYNYLHVQLRVLEQYYVTFADRVGFIVQRLLGR